MKQIFVFSIITLSLVFLPQLANAAATLYFSPSTGSYTINNTFSVTVMVNTGTEAVNVVGAYITYPQDKLEFLSIDTTGSILTMWAENKAEGGKISLSGGVPSPGFSGSKKIATIRFKAKASSGTANLIFNSDSAVITNSGNQNILNLTSSGQGSYTLKAVVVTPPEEEEEEEQPSQQEEENTVVESEQEESTTTEQEETIEEETLPPVNYGIQITVLNANSKKPVYGAKISILNETGFSNFTDQEGKVTTEIPRGQYEVSVEYADKTSKYYIDVTEADGGIQEFEIPLDFSVSPFEKYLPLTIIITSALIIITLLSLIIANIAGKSKKLQPIV